jgi:hypothetical protein
MILFDFILHLIATTSLFKIAISFTVNSNCGYREEEVTSWVEEASFLFDRAAKVLEFGMTPSVMNILYVCLGSSGATPENFEAIKSESYYHVLNMTAYIELMMDYSFYK